MTITLEHTINETETETENGILNSFKKCFVERRTPIKLEMVFTKIRPGWMTVKTNAIQNVLLCIVHICSF